MATKKQSAAKAAADKKLGEILANSPPPPKDPEPTPGCPPADMGGMPTQVSHPMGMASDRPMPLDEGESSLVQQLNDLAADAERLGRAIMLKTVANRYKSTFDIAASAAVRRIKAAITSIC